MDRLLDLEARGKVLKIAMADAPVDQPDIHPNNAAIYAQKVERLAEALNHPDDRDDATNASRADRARDPGPRRKARRDACHASWRVRGKRCSQPTAVHGMSSPTLLAG